jgi:hypothetical protein
MVRAAIAGDDRFEASDMELRREGPSYTVDTLRELRAERPDDELFLILGADQLAELDTWREPDEVRRLATIVGFARDGEAPPDLKGRGSCGSRGWTSRPRRCGAGWARGADGVPGARGVESSDPTGGAVRLRSPSYDMPLALFGRRVYDRSARSCAFGLRPDTGPRRWSFRTQAFRRGVMKGRNRGVFHECDDATNPR